MTRTTEEQYLHELIESYVAPLRREIKELRKELAQQQVKNLNIPDVIKSVCDDCTAYPFDKRGETPFCKACEDNPKQTVL